jgi:ABC-type Fe3+ transport system permease subunit
MLALLFRTIEAFKLADLVILLTKGGNDTMTISYHLIRIANEQNKTSEGAAISYLMLFMVIVLTNLYLYLANRRSQEPDMASSASFMERLGFRKASGVGEAGWGRTLFVAIIAFIYFLPVLFIIFTAIKPQPCAVGSAHAVAHIAVRPDPGTICLHADARELRLRLLASMTVGGAPEAPASTATSSTPSSSLPFRWLLALVIGTLAAFGFSRYPLKGNDTYLFIILTTRMLPPSWSSSRSS